jgi:hypothetical protein
MRRVRLTALAVAEVVKRETEIPFALTLGSDGVSTSAPMDVPAAPLASSLGPRSADRHKGVLPSAAAKHRTASPFPGSYALDASPQQQQQQRQREWGSSTDASSSGSKTPVRSMTPVPPDVYDDVFGEALLVGGRCELIPSIYTCSQCRCRAACCLLVVQPPPQTGSKVALRALSRVVFAQPRPATPRTAELARSTYESICAGAAPQASLVVGLDEEYLDADAGGLVGVLAQLLALSFPGRLETSRPHPLSLSSALSRLLDDAHKLVTAEAAAPLIPEAAAQAVAMSTPSGATPLGVEASTPPAPVEMGTAPPSRLGTLKDLLGFISMIVSCYPADQYGAVEVVRKAHVMGKAARDSARLRRYEQRSVAASGGGFDGFAAATSGIRTGCLCSVCLSESQGRRNDIAASASSPSISSPYGRVFLGSPAPSDSISFPAAAIAADLTPAAALIDRIPELFPSLTPAHPDLRSSSGGSGVVVAPQDLTQESVFSSPRAASADDAPTSAGFPDDAFSCTSGRASADINLLRPASDSPIDGGDGDDDVLEVSSPARSAPGTSAASAPLVLEQSPRSARRPFVPKLPPRRTAGDTVVRGQPGQTPAFGMSPQLLQLPPAMATSSSASTLTPLLPAEDGGDDVCATSSPASALLHASGDCRNGAAAGGGGVKQAVQPLVPLVSNIPTSDDAVGGALSLHASGGSVSERSSMSGLRVRLPKDYSDGAAESGIGSAPASHLTARLIASHDAPDDWYSGAHTDPGNLARGAVAQRGRSDSNTEPRSRGLLLGRKLPPKPRRSETFPARSDLAEQLAEQPPAVRYEF